jgi:dTDP-4-dehydrorhamnose reductase
MWGKSSEDEPISHYDFNKALCRRYGWDDSRVVANEENENIYYLNNKLRKSILKTKISGIQK